ncbi:MAG: hypothetical protein IJU23_09010, partial [Proteobacteria bacterium]|nr:hypothetical protein [Pseudomonadota bacterium]
MNKLKLYDFVKFTYRGKEREGMIVNLKQKTAVVLIKKENKKRSFPLEQLEYVPPFVIEPDFIRKLCRYELKGHGFKKLILGKDNIIYEPCYTLTFEDLLIAFQNIRQSGNSKDTVRKEWFEPVYDLFISKKNGVFENTPQDVEIYEYLPNRRRYLYVIFCKYLYSAFNGLDDSLEIDKNSISDTISKIEKYIHQILADEKKPAIERTYTDD